MTPLETPPRQRATSPLAVGLMLLGIAIAAVTVWFIVGTLLLDRYVAGTAPTAHTREIDLTLAYVRYGPAVLAIAIPCMFVAVLAMRARRHERRRRTIQ